ncbi:hypothetical protein BDW72DRAFT_72013 [Aspergillus terricola var. indicus]
MRYRYCHGDICGSIIPPAALLPFSSKTLPFPFPLLEQYSSQFIQSPRLAFSVRFDLSKIGDRVYQSPRNSWRVSRFACTWSPSASDRAPQPDTSGSPIAFCAHRGQSPIYSAGFQILKNNPAFNCLHLRNVPLSIIGPRLLARYFRSAALSTADVIASLFKVITSKTGIAYTFASS